MRWFRVDVGTARHPKLLELSPLDRWKWLTLLDDAAHYETGGVVRPGALRDAGVGAKLLGRLLELRLLEPADEEGCYVLHDWGLINGRNEAEREAARIRKQRQRARQAGTDLSEKSALAERIDLEPAESNRQGEPLNRAASGENVPRDVTPLSRVTTPARLSTTTEELTTKLASYEDQGPAREAPASSSSPASSSGSAPEPVAEGVLAELERLRALAPPPASWGDDEGQGDELQGDGGGPDYPEAA